MITEVNEYPADDKKVLVTFLMDRELLEKMEKDAEHAKKWMNMFTSLESLAQSMTNSSKTDLIVEYLKLAGVKEKV